MKQGLLFAMMVGGFLGACATQYEWIKPDFNQAQASQDALECTATAERLRSNAQHGYELCMQSKGYSIKQKKEVLSW